MGMLFYLFITHFKSFYLLGSRVESITKKNNMP